MNLCARSHAIFHASYPPCMEKKSIGAPYSSFSSIPFLCSVVRISRTYHCHERSYCSIFRNSRISHRICRRTNMCRQCAESYFLIWNLLFMSWSNLVGKFTKFIWNRIVEKKYVQKCLRWFHHSWTAEKNTSYRSLTTVNELTLCVVIVGEYFLAAEKRIKATTYQCCMFITPSAIYKNRLCGNNNHDQVFAALFCASISYSI